MDINNNNTLFLLSHFTIKVSKRLYHYATSAVKFIYSLRSVIVFSSNSFFCYLLDA